MMGECLVMRGCGVWLTNFPHTLLNVNLLSTKYTLHETKINITRITVSNDSIM